MTKTVGQDPCLSIRFSRCHTVALVVLIECSRYCKGSCLGSSKACFEAWSSSRYHQQEPTFALRGRYVLGRYRMSCTFLESLLIQAIAWLFARTKASGLPSLRAPTSQAIHRFVNLLAAQPLRFTCLCSSRSSGIRCSPVDCMS